MTREKLFLLLSSCQIILCMGCAGLPVDNDFYVPGALPAIVLEDDVPEIVQGEVVDIETVEEAEIIEEVEGVYHKVKPGETVWRIAKAYNVKIDELIRTNNIPDAAQIEKNQLILVPGAANVLDIAFDVEDISDEFIWPVKGRIIKYFGQSSPTSPVNKGISIKVNEGDLVKASRSGRVVFADYLNGYGYTIILEHSDGFHTVYGNNSKLLVTLGDEVKKNRAIAHVGRLNQMAFLHFEVRKGSKEDNPLHYLP